MVERRSCEGTAQLTSTHLQSAMESMRYTCTIESIRYNPSVRTVTDTLRKAVKDCGQTRYAISKATGIPQAVLSRFVTNGRGLRSENIDRLCAHLGLMLTTKPGKTRKGR